MEYYYFGTQLPIDRFLTHSFGSGVRCRVVGVLLGQVNGKTVNVANSFGIPFKEDENEQDVVFGS